MSYCFLHTYFLFKQTQADLFDYANSQVDELRTLLKGNIAVAHNNLQSLLYSFYDFSGDMDGFGIIHIQNYENQIKAEINQLKELATTAEVDISYCLIDKEQLLTDISTQKIAAMKTCMASLTIEAAEIVTNSKYLVDVTYNKVDAIQFQINQCSSDACLEPIIELIMSDNIKLPEQIKVELSTATDFVDTLKVSTQNCRENNVAEFTASSDVLLNDITNCANDLLEKI